jgi:peptidoglycan-N-acetylglucosamine deacetylase
VQTIGLALLCVAVAGCHHGAAREASGTPAALPASASLPRPARAKPPQAAMARLMHSGRPIYCGGAHRPYAALTFDDGPGPYTPLALRILRRAHVPATFFLVGRNVAPFRSSARREARRYALGNHTFTHPMLTALPAGAILSELTRTSAAIRRRTGYSVHLFRPPYEAHDATVDALARHLGLLEILWNVDSGDSEGANYAHIARRVKRGLSNGAIVLMHENRGQTIRALKFLILPALRKRDLRLVTVPRLLALDPPSAAQLRRGRNGCRYHAVPRVRAG